MRVLNDDIIAPKKGFGSHPHRDAEIFTYVISGQLEHRDSLGTGAVIHPGEIQYMSAGRGVLHSEFNPSETDSVHLLQIWLTPNQRSAVPRYEQRDFSSSKNIECVLSGAGRAGAIAMRADSEVFLGRLAAGSKVTQELTPFENGWLHLISGEISLDQIKLKPGDDVAIMNQEGTAIEAHSDCEFLLFSLQ